MKKTALFSGKVFCTYLLRHNELDFASEIRLITDSEDEAKELLRKSDIISDEELRSHRITIMSRKRMTNQTPIEDFRRLLATKITDHEEAKPVESIYSPSPEASRLMECLSVKERDGIPLLCDDERSLMRKRYASTLVILRSYEFPR